MALWGHGRGFLVTPVSCSELAYGSGGRRMVKGRLFQEMYGFEGETAQTIHVNEPETFTGLYNHLGEPLHRPKEPIGFQPHRWDNQMKKTKKDKDGKGC